MDAVFSSSVIWYVNMEKNIPFAYVAPFQQEVTMIGK